MRLGEFEKKQRVKNGRTQLEIARALGYKDSCASDISRLETDRRIRLMNGVRFRYIRFYVTNGETRKRAKELMTFCDDLRTHEIQYLKYMAM